MANKVGEAIAAMGLARLRRDNAARAVETATVEGALTTRLRNELGDAKAAFEQSVTEVLLAEGERIGLLQASEDANAKTAEAR